MKRKMIKRGNLIVICGPSGVGKGTVVKKLRELKEFYFSVSVTTRAPREGEVNGVDYVYVTVPEFQEMIDNNMLLEHAVYADTYYGSPRAPVEENLAAGFDVLLEIELDGARQIKKSMPEAKTIFILPPSIEVLESRLRGRGTETEEKIVKRLKRAEYELSCADEFDYCVVNDVAERVAKEILEIINNI